MERQAATTKGLQRRLRDLQLCRVSDPRQPRKVTYELPTLLSSLVAAMVTEAPSLRGVEQRTGQMAQQHGQWLGLTGRVADNTFGKLLARLPVGELLDRLHAMVKAEQRRGNLKPKVLPVGTVAIDGKNVATLRWPDLCRVLKLDPALAPTDQVKAELAQKYPDVQLCVPEQGQPYALARVHTVTLISSEAAQCIHQRPIAGCTNEIGSMPQLLEQLHTAYGRTGLFAMLTTDAGNTSLEAATKVNGYGWHYLMQIKSGHQDLHAEATRVLGRKTAKTADHTEADQQNGKLVTYQLWHYHLGEQGWLQWTHARQLIRLERTTLDQTTGELTVGNRYYVCNRSPADLGPKSCLNFARAHWRCEDETHWTADAILHEDRRRLAWSRHPNGVFIVSVLRMIALNILAVARKLSRFGHSLETPSWHQVAEHFLLVLCGSILLTEAFDAEI